MASVSQRRKATAADYPIPQDREAAARQLAEIGQARRDIAARKSAAEADATRVATAFEEALTPLQSRLEALERGLQVWSEAHRSELTGDGRQQHHDFATGKVLWRRRPPAVTLRGKVAEIVARLKDLNFTRFIRVKEEVDKEALLREPEVAASVAGISVGSAGEDFVIEPLSIESDGARA